MHPRVCCGEVSNETCPKKDEERDDQEPPACCVHNLMKEGPEGKECVKVPSDMSVAVAITLILSFTFLISLQCFMNHHKTGIRAYTYQVISQTISIFSAVLTFQSLDGIVDDVISEPLREKTGWKGVDIVVNSIHMLFWYVATQFTLAYVSKALMPDEWRKQQKKEMRSDHHKGNHTNVMLDVEIDSQCYGITLAHLTGFAASNFWTGLQQLDPFIGSPLLSLVPIVIAVLGQLTFERLTNTCRSCYIALQGDKDWFETTWDDKCKEAEDEIMGLSLSVMLVNSLRYANNTMHGYKCSPNSEQKEEGPACEFERGIWQPLWLFAFGLVFVVLLFLTKLAFVKMSEEALRMSYLESKRVRNLIAGDLSDDLDDEADKKCCSQLVERLEDVIIGTWAMSHSWCIFHGTREFLMVANPSYLGQDANATTLAVVLATGVTYVAMVFVRVLDTIATLPDRFRPREEFEVCIRTVMNGSSIFIGFAWEQTFDESVSQLAERTRKWDPHAPAFAKLVIGTICVVVIFLAWKWYILPFVFKKGWRYGYIFSRNDLHERCRELAEFDVHFTGEHLRTVAENLAAISDDHADRFSIGDNVSSRDKTDSYLSLAGSEDEALRRQIEDLKAQMQSMNAELTEEKKAGGEWKKQRRALERQIAEESSLGSDAEPLRMENKELQIHMRYLEQQLTEERKAAEDWKIHRRFLERQLTEARVASFNGGSAPSGEVHEMREAIQELKVHTRHLEEQLAEERAARLDKSLFPSDGSEPLRAGTKAATYLQQQNETERKVHTKEVAEKQSKTQTPNTARSSSVGRPSPKVEFVPLRKLFENSKHRLRLPPSKEDIAPGESSTSGSRSSSATQSSELAGSRFAEARRRLQDVRVQGRLEDNGTASGSFRLHLNSARSAEGRTSNPGSISTSSVRSLESAAASPSNGAQSESTKPMRFSSVRFALPKEEAAANQATPGGAAWNRRTL